MTSTQTHLHHIHHDEGKGSNTQPVDDLDRSTFTPLLYTFEVLVLPCWHLNLPLRLSLQQTLHNTADSCWQLSLSIFFFCSSLTFTLSVCFRHFSDFYWHEKKSLCETILPNERHICWSICSLQTLRLQRDVKSLHTRSKPRSRTRLHLYNNLYFIWEFPFSASCLNISFIQN